MRQRIITALIAAPLVLGLVGSTSVLPVLLLGGLCVYAALWEVFHLVDKQPRSGHALLGSLGFFGLGFWLNGIHPVQPVVVSLMAIALLVMGILAMNWERMNRQTLKFFLSLWVVAPMLGLIAIHPLPGSSAAWWPSPIFMALIPVWVGDIAAIFVGKSLGKNLMAPGISPAKTWEGAMGGLVGSMVAGCILAVLLRYPISVGCLCGLIAGSLGQVGDLLESAFKRRFGAKDSGTLLPGHGGMLDRIDSLLLPALPIALVLALTMHR